MARLCEGHRWQAPKQVLGFGISIHFVWMAVFLVNESAMEARNKNWLILLTWVCHDKEWIRHWPRKDDVDLEGSFPARYDKRKFRLESEISDLLRYKEWMPRASSCTCSLKSLIFGHGLLYSPNSSWAEWGSQFLLEAAFVPSWFAGSSWFRLGFRCLSPFLSLLSFLRTGVLFHHDLLVPLGSGWDSGACLPSSLFLSSRKGFCSVTICWFLLVPAGVPVLVSLLLSSFFPQDRGSVPSWFAGSSWFQLGFRCLSPLFSLLWFRCLSPFFSLLSFLRTGVLFHHDLLVPPGSGWGSGASLPPSLFFGSSACLFFLSSGKGFCSIMICWMGFRCLSPSFSLPQVGGSVPSWFAGSSWFRLGFRCLSPFFSLLWFRCLSPFFSLLSFLRTGVLFHHDLLVPLGSCWGSGACLPYSLFFGSGACLPSSLFFLFWGKGFCSMICWVLLVPAGVPVLVSFFSLLWFRCLSPFFSLLSFLRTGVLFHHDLLGPLGSGWGSGACLPSSLSFGSGACLPSSLFFFFWGKGFCSMVPAGVPVLVSFFSLLWFRCLSPFFFSLLSFLRKGVLFHHDLSNRQPDGSLHILIDLFHGQLCLFSRKSHGLVLALLFSRDNSLYQFWTRLKIKDLHSVWIPGCVASLLLPRICTVEVMKE